MKIIDKLIDRLFETRFAKKILCREIRTKVNNKIGFDTDIEFHDVHLTVNDGVANLHIDADISLDKISFKKVLETINLI